jgi:hypothetical protein
VPRVFDIAELRGLIARLCDHGADERRTVLELRRIVVAGFQHAG